MSLKYEVYGVREDDDHKSLRELLAEIAGRGERVVSVTSQESLPSAIHIQPRFTVVTEKEVNG